MSVRLKNIEDQVIVITGASSGIGLTTARMAAEQGARLVLAARNEEALHQLTDEIRDNGGEAIYVVADVGREEDVQRIAHQAIEAFGGFDTWINDAGVGIYGSVLDVSTEDSRRLFDTNFWGVVYGSLEAARHLRERNDSYGGAIINVGSEVSDRAVPLMGMYSASKHAVKAFTDALRMELEKEEAPISVTLVKPGATDTPFPQHAGNYLEEEPKLPEPVYAPEVVAEVILHCVETPERDMFAAGSAKAHSTEAGMMPRILDWMMEKSYFEKQKSGRPATHAEEALHAPSTGLKQRSGTRDDARETSLYTKASMHPLWTTALLAGGALLLTGLVRGAWSDGSA
jgi:short-subunit dehydrogenase